MEPGGNAGPRKVRSLADKTDNAFWQLVLEGRRKNDGPCLCLGKQRKVTPVIEEADLLRCRSLQRRDTTKTYPSSRLRPDDFGFRTLRKLSD